MRILLPPSEAKRADAGRRRRALSTAPVLALDGERLAESRAQVAAALIEFCRTDRTAAAAALALPARSVDDDLDANSRIFEAPVLPALDRYAGTVYEGFDAATLTPAARRRALESVLVFSGLFGVLQAGEQVPVYRLPVAAVLPSVGALTPYWRRALAEEMTTLVGDDLTIDMRSSDYSAMWRPGAAARDQVVSVRVLSELPGGRLAVVSYPSKHGKGRLARALVSSRARVRSAVDVAQAWTDAGGRDATVHPDGRIELLTA